VRYNDWVNGKQQIWKTYFDWFSQANKDIVIICSYFLPGRILRRQLTKAAKKGVRVQVILSAVSDVPITKYAERYLYRWMLRHGIEIYEYQPTVLHAKLMVADKHRVTIGSYNVNNISTYASTEVNLDVRNRIFGRYMHYTLQSLIQKDCIPVTSLSPLVNVSWIKKLLQLVCYQVIRLVLTLSTFYYRQE
jgi:cardiolipin synthase